MDQSDNACIVPISPGLVHYSPYGQSQVVSMLLPVTSGDEFLNRRLNFTSKGTQENVSMAISTTASEPKVMGSYGPF